MFKKTLELLIFIYLSLCGVALIVIALLSQGSVLAELDGYTISFFELVKYSLNSRTWWHIVGSPFLVGLLFVAIAFKVKKDNLNSKNTQRLLFIIFGISIISIPFTLVEGYVCTLTSAICLILQTIKIKHNNSLQPTAERGG